MKKVAIFMSDFHLGRKDGLEEFFADEEFAELLGRLSRDHADDEVDLVLLGDVMDLWTTSMDPVEQHAEVATQIKLHFPVGSDNNTLEMAEEDEIKKAKAITQAHPLFFQALGFFLGDSPIRRRIVYVPGNHDHSVVCSEVQEVIRRSILTKRVMATTKCNFEIPDESGVTKPFDESMMEVEFKCWYEDDELLVYAEHGNQLTYGGTFRYKSFDKFGEECPGYYQFKLVSNRLERCAPELNSVFMQAFEPAKWPGILVWLLLQGNFRAFTRLTQFQVQYKHDSRDGVVQARRQLPSQLKTAWHLFISRWFSYTKDEFGAPIQKFFNPLETKILPVRGKPLNPLKVKTVILGHSHHHKDVAIPGVEGGRYYNTGGWLMRVENGRQVVDQVWVTISTDLAQLKQGPTHRRTVINREMIHRKVECAKCNPSPITHDGQNLTPILSEMTDLRVGDVVLLRWNFSAMIGRLLRKGQLWTLAKTIPGMILGWFNRKGSDSAWNHVALVYASPSEPAERDSYNEPLFLEAVPDKGVSITGPHHYLEHPKDWDLAVLRLKAHWLHHQPDGWDRRRLLRRLALGQLNAHYDTDQVKQQSYRELIDSMDARGKSFVGGLVKGAVIGVVLGALFFLFHHGSALLKGLHSPAGWEEFTPSDYLNQIRDTTTDVLDKTHIIPFIQWAQLSAFFESPGWLSTLGGVISFSIVVIAIVGGLGVLLLLLGIGMSGSAIYGALWGALMVPAITELAEGWNKRAIWLRLLITGLWLAIPMGAFFLASTLVENPTLADTFQLTPVGQGGTPIQKWLMIEFVVLVWMTLLGSIILVTHILISIFGFVDRRAHRKAAEAIAKSEQAMLPRRVTQEETAIEQRFICSTLAQYALVTTAEAIKSEVPGAVKDVDQFPPWQKYLPRDFAASEKFNWVYVLHNGRVTKNPNESYKAQVNPPPLSESPRRLCKPACWACVIALLSVCLMIVADLEKIGHCKGLFWSCREFSVFWFFAGAIFCGVLAIILARVASVKLALGPAEIQGYVLTYWSRGIAALSLLGSLLVSMDRDLLG